MKFAVVGGGLSGLMAARSLRVAHPDSDITLIERSDKLGGLLAGTYYEDQDLYFDQGTHIFRETGNPEIDDFILNSIPASDLIHFEPGQGDLAGAVFNGRLQTNSHFPDIRERHDYKALRKSLEDRATSSVPIPDVNRLDSFVENACDRFGELYTAQVLSPILSDLYQKPASQLAGFALLLPGLTRIVATEHADWASVAKCNPARTIFAVPDQRHLPDSYQQKKRSYYCRSKGSHGFIEGIRRTLEKSNVHIVCNATIISLNLAQSTLTFINRSTETSTLKVDGIVLATGVIGAAHLLGLPIENFGLDRPIKNKIVNLIVDDIAESDLCYLYGLDPEAEFYRVTNYRGFSGNPQDRRISIEILGEIRLELEKLPTHLVSQLYAYGFLTSEKFSFSDVFSPKRGFAIPSIQNAKALDALNKEIEYMLPDNVICGGIGTGKNLFFQNEVIEFLYERASQLV